MFTLLKSGWSNLLRGDPTTNRVSLKQDVLSSDEDFLFIPNRKRSHVDSLFNMNNGTESKLRKEKSYSPCSDEESIHVKFATSVEDVNDTNVETDVEMPIGKDLFSPLPYQKIRTPMLRRMMTIDMTELTLEGIPFQSSSYDIEMQVREMLRDNPPCCPRLPDINFDFALEKAVLGR